ncbi:gp596 [Bacillus phage G]|uniref:Gp596 n=1 Tax=Bacillus phage G TaxID=2884420 RepID=G3MAX6_9CAUD|nr:gp596 [Bacillus phage G]AEO93841.1 gp596 [Bacillus phage G]
MNIREQAEELMKAKLNGMFLNILNDFPQLSDSQKEEYLNQFKHRFPSDKFKIISQMQKAETNLGILRVIERHLGNGSSRLSDEAERKTKHRLMRDFGITPDQTETFDEYLRSVIADNKKERVFTSEPEAIEEEKKVSSLESLNKLIGLEKVKEQVQGLIAHEEISKLRASHGLKHQKHTLHMMFKGNPGTGKTTVARLLGEIFKEIGVLSTGHVVEIDRASLVSRYQGDFEERVTEFVNKAKGGILFIDEIYSLFDSGKGDDQSQRGIPVLLKLIEDQREDFICIGAGYTKEVNQFLESNPGLKSRFPVHIEFDDYTEEQLIAIATSMLGSQDYKMDDEFIEKFKKCVEEEKQHKDFGNARTVRNIIESSIRQQSLRLFSIDKQDLNKDKLSTIIGGDFKYEPLRLEEEEAL